MAGKRGQQRASAMPILSCYLTFIHYFGFSINPNDDVNSRYLSIRVKRAPTGVVQMAGHEHDGGGSSNNNFYDRSSNERRRRRRRQRLEVVGLRATNNIGSENNQSANRPPADQWLASYRLRAQRTIGSLTSLLIAVLKSVIKFTAISFTTFIALNHCIVLCDYIYNGSKVFKELMLEVRLVTTKISALIFVLSWHYNQAKVRQLIKLVKSTSAYIMGIHGSAQLEQQQEPPFQSPPLPTSWAGSSLAGFLGSAGAAGGGAEWPWRAPAADALRELKRSAACRQRERSPIGLLQEGADASREPCWSPSSCSSWTTATNTPQTGRSLRRGHDGTQTTPTTAVAVAAGETMEEIGDTLLMDTTQIDRRILKWWLMCVCVTILHFSLSEAEITNSNSHLWQWLDDYSLHQLNNQTTSNSTLMLLASIDNYIYTVHVYGTRLIGASIICIVCSLQRENISSLRWHTLQLIQRSASTSTAGGGGGAKRTDAPKVAACVADDNNNNNNNNDDDEKSNNDNNSIYYCDIRRRSRAPLSWFTRFRGGDRCSPPHESGNNEQHPEEDEEEEAPSPAASVDRSMFFVLGESDWLKVRDNVSRLQPSGHLSGSLWAIRRCTGRARNLLGGPSRDDRVGSGGGRSWRHHLRRRHHHDNNNLDRPRSSAAPSSAVSLSSRDNDEADDAFEANQVQCSRRRRQRQRLARVTPNPTCAPLATLDQLAASSMMMNGSETTTTTAAAVVNNNARLTPKSWTQKPTNERENIIGDATAAADCAGNGLAQHNQSNSLPSAHNKLHTSNTSPTSKAAAFNFAARRCRRPSGQLAADNIEWQLDRLASKYELVRTVNARIDACFGPMLLFQYSSLFVMSCIDVVYFSICFNPNTKTKYIIISGMILLWWPYLLLYKFASDIGSSSKELLTSVRRLARLSLIETHSSSGGGGGATHATGTYGSPFGPTPQSFVARYPPPPPPPYFSAIAAGGHSDTASSATYRGPFRLAGKMARARIINKLDHVFKPTHLSIMGIMTMNKFFLLNFAKIVITASVMIIQFII